MNPHQHIPRQPSQQQRHDQEQQVNEERVTPDIAAVTPMMPPIHQQASRLTMIAPPANLTRAQIDMHVTNNQPSHTFYADPFAALSADTFQHPTSSSSCAAQPLLSSFHHQPPASSVPSTLPLFPQYPLPLGAATDTTALDPSAVSNMRAVSTLYSYQSRARTLVHSSFDVDSTALQHRHQPSGLPLVMSTNFAPLRTLDPHVPLNNVQLHSQPQPQAQAQAQLQLQSSLQWLNLGPSDAVDTQEHGRQVSFDYSPSRADPFSLLNPSDLLKQSDAPQRQSQLAVSMLLQPPPTTTAATAQAPPISLLGIPALQTPVALRPNAFSGILQQTQPQPQQQQQTLFTSQLQLGLPEATIPLSGLSGTCLPHPLTGPPLIQPPISTTLLQDFSRLSLPARASSSIHESPLDSNERETNIRVQQQQQQRQQQQQKRNEEFVNQFIFGSILPSTRSNVEASPLCYSYGISDGTTTAEQKTQGIASMALGHSQLLEQPQSRVRLAPYGFDITSMTSTTEKALKVVPPSWHTATQLTQQTVHTAQVIQAAQAVQSAQQASVLILNIPIHLPKSQTTEITHNQSINALSTGVAASLSTFHALQSDNEDGYSGNDNGGNGGDDKDDAVDMAFSADPSISPRTTAFNHTLPAIDSFQIAPSAAQPWPPFSLTMPLLPLAPLLSTAKTAKTATSMSSITNPRAPNITSIPESILLKLKSTKSRKQRDLSAPKSRKQRDPSDPKRPYNKRPVTEVPIRRWQPPSVESAVPARIQVYENDIQFINITGNPDDYQHVSTRRQAQQQQHQHQQQPSSAPNLSTPNTSLTTLPSNIPNSTSTPSNSTNLAANSTSHPPPPPSSSSSSSSSPSSSSSSS